MSQASTNIPNSAGAVFRANLNAAIEAIITQNSGATEPTTTYPNMWWYDTSTSLLKRRNNANDAWIVLGLEAADTDGTLAANSDSKVATQKATKTYVDAKTIAENRLSLSDNTTANASTSAHGFLKKLSNVATEFMNGQGNWVTIGGREYFASGSGSWTAPAGVTKVFITAIAGGGGGGSGASGGNAGSGGGGGASLVKYPYTVIPGNSYSYSVGAKGVKGALNADDATAGGNTTFDAITLTGGGRGRKAIATPGAAGTSSLGFLNGIAGTAESGATGGNGGVGNSMFGVASPGAAYPNAGTDAVGFGAGAGGGCGNYSQGGDGTPGFLLLEY